MPWWSHCSGAPLNSKARSAPRLPRAYVPASVWSAIKDAYVAEVNRIVVGDVSKAGVYMGAVIDQKAFTSITGAIQRAADDDGCEIVTGGTWDDSTGWFIQPTTIVCSDPMYETMQVELFGPVLSIHVYDDADFERMIGVVDSTSEYALTGSIFATDRRHVETAMAGLRYAAGNFYINDKPTGAVVGQQPFGGARGSGTNDKAGSPLNLLRWVSPRSIKETFAPPTDWTYPFLG